MKTLACILVLLSCVTVQAAEVTLVWDANKEPYLAGYKIHYGNASRSYTQTMDVGNVTEYTVQDLTPGGTYYFAATAYSIPPVTESDYSNEVVYQVPYEMSPPGNFRKSPLERIADAVERISQSDMLRMEVAR